jgi:hypothetical protein
VQQLPPQQVSPAGQSKVEQGGVVHMPLAQTSVPEQAVPHPPQW